MNDTEQKTRQHIARVRQLINEIIIQLQTRAMQHDQSKLNPPELEVFEIYTKKLKGTTYGSDEYKQHLKEMKPALDHHYQHNRHHPEHFEEGITGMNLVDIVEMLCDWKAATERHADGDIVKSITLNKERFCYNDILESILTNTIEMIKE